MSVARCKKCGSPRGLKHEVFVYRAASLGTGSAESLECIRRGTRGSDTEEREEA